MPDKMTYEVPVKYGWATVDMDTELFDNIKNYTFEQLESICDFVSKETKIVEYVMPDEQFNIEQEAIHQNIFSI